MKTYMFQHIKTKNDTNGNPRRLFLVLDLAGTVLEAIDEGYQGRGALTARGYDLKNAIELPSIETLPSEYKSILKEFSKGH